MAAPLPDPAQTRRPIRLLQIASTSEIGGAEQLMLSFIRYADRSRVVPSLLAIMAEGPLPDLARAAGAEAEGWRVRNAADPRNFLRMRNFLRAGRYDVIQTYGLRADLLARPFARGTGARLASAIVSIDPWRRWHHTALDRMTRRGVSAWMSTSEAATRAKIEREAVPPSLITTIPTGISERAVVDDAGRLAARANFGLGPEDGPVLAIVANVRPAKGYPDLIDAVARLLPRWPRLVCLCAGRDDSGGAIPALARERGAGNAMRWLGYQSDAPAAYDAADLAVLTSHWEGMPHALIEAIRAGRATVATDVGGNGEVVRHEIEGLLAPARNPEALAAAIDRALGDPDARAAWARNARARFETGFRVEMMVGRMTEFYETITAGKKRG